MGGGGRADEHLQGWSAEGEAASPLPNGEPERGLASSPGRPEEERDDSVSSSSPSLISFASARDVSFVSSVATSRSSSFSPDFDVDFDVGVDGTRHRVVHCEVEEIPSFRWLPSPLRWFPSPRRGQTHWGRRSSHASTAKSPVPIGWELLLPSDYEEIISRTVSPVEYSSREQLYLRLCEPILIDKGLKMVWLEKPTGKKCYMLSARAINIIWGKNARYWRWISVPDARFPEVAELIAVYWLEIRASISPRDLSPGTRYGAYLVMRLSGSSRGLEDPPQETVISVRGVHTSKRTVRLQDRQSAKEGNEVTCVPRARGDGWMELEMGDFFVEAGGKKLVNVRLEECQSLHWKSGLIVHGIEVRPIPTRAGNEPSRAELLVGSAQLDAESLSST